MYLFPLVTLFGIWCIDFYNLIRLDVVIHMTTKDKANDLRVTSREAEGFGTRLLKTSGDEGVSIIEACMIEEDNGCEAYRVDDVAANDKVKEVFVNNTTRVDDDH